MPRPVRDCIRRVSARAKDLAGLPAPEKVGSRFLFLLQTPAGQILSGRFSDPQGPAAATVRAISLGVPLAERSGKLLSESPSLSEAWGLAILLYKLFLQQIQPVDIVV